MKKTKTVLVIEPDHDVRVEIRRMLEEKNYAVVSTANGNEAFTLLHDMTLPSLILLSSSPGLLYRDKFLEKIGAEPQFNAIPVLHLLRHEDLKQVLETSL
jgi:CheY-like chemotaxis protein